MSHQFTKVGLRSSGMRFVAMALIIVATTACSESSTSVGEDVPLDRQSDDATKDRGPIDANEPLDVPVADAPPDASPADRPLDRALDAGACATSDDCTEDPGRPVCLTSAGTCVTCTEADDRCPPAEHCVDATHSCVPGCRSDEGCRAGGRTLLCNRTTHECVACLQDGDCPSGQVCIASRGACAPVCEPDRGCGAGRTCCDLRECVDVMTHTSHCGACGRACSGGAHASPTCAAGVCGVRCEDGFGDCNARTTDGCETDLSAAPQHCGRCGNACPAGSHQSSSCASGECRTRCDEGWGDCNGRADDGCETDLGANALHCGRCDNACVARPRQTVACTAGTCVRSCEANFADCNGLDPDGCEVDTRVDDAHCGACGTRCAASEACVVGRCTARCASAEISCLGRCVNPLTDHANCGACGRDCGRGECRAGDCTPYRIAELPTSRAVSLAFDGTYLYTGGAFEGTLYRIRAEPPGTPERLYSGPSYLMGIQWFAGTLFWNSYRESNVYRAAASGAGMPSSAALGVADPGDILVEDDFIYAVSYQSATSPVYRIPRAGGAPVLFATVPENGGGELFRLPGGPILVSGQYHDSVWQISTTGAVSRLLNLGSGRAAQQLGADDRSLFVTSYVGPQGSGQILRIDLASRAVTLAARDLDSPYGLVVTDTMIYFTNYFTHDVWGMRK